MAFIKMQVSTSDSTATDPEKQLSVDYQGREGRRGSQHEELEEGGGVEGLCEVEVG